MKRTLLSILVIGILLLSACDTPNTAPTPELTPTPTPAPTTTPPPTPTPTPTPTPSPTPTPRPTPTPTPTPEEPNWWPDSSKVIVCSKLALEEGAIVAIPPDDMRIVPFEIGQGERIQTLSLTAVSGGGFQSFFRDSRGNFVLENPLMPWEPGVYYLHIRNESLPSESSEYCKVKLIIRFMPD